MMFETIFGLIGLAGLVFVSAYANVVYADELDDQINI